MKVRKRLRIVENRHNTDLKINLYFLASSMGLSGWIVHLGEGIVGAEIQGEEEHVDLYIEHIVTKFHIRQENVRCYMVEKKPTDRESLKIG